MNGYWAAAVVSLWLLLIVIGVAQLGLLRRVAPLLDEDHHDHHPAVAGLSPGETPGEFVATDPAGATVGREALLGRPTVVLLSSAGCTPCERLARELAAADPWTASDLVVITSADGHLALPPWVTVLRQRGLSAAEAFRTHATPHAFALDADGTVLATAVPAGVGDLAALRRA